MTESAVFQPQNHLIMAVDDVPANLKVLQGVLIPAGYRVTFATHGRQVVDRVQDIKPDLILLDLMMPEMSGIEVCTVLKGLQGVTHIPVIFLTASHEREHLVQAFDCGAVDYVTKPFDPVELLTRVRNHLELSQLRQQAQMQAAWESISRQIIQDIYASIDLQAVLDNTTRAIQQLLQANRVMVYRWCDPQGCRLMAIAGPTLDVTNQESCAAGADCPFLQENPDAMPKVTRRPICLMAPETAMPLTQTDFEKTPLNPQTEQRFPIYQEGVLWGGLVIYSTPCSLPMDDRAIDILMLIVQQLEISIQHATLHQRLKQANEELQWVSNTDSLTQVANRRCFDARFDQEWQRLQRAQQPLSIILCDIDHFKRFNDTYGHLRGDLCLAAIARTLKSCLKRSADLVARYGGEEFVILLPNTRLSGAIEIVQQVRSLIATLKITHKAQNHITLSFGIHTLIPSIDAAPKTALAITDHALYEAKKTGRNRYAIAPEATAD